ALDLDPVPRAAPLVGAARPLRHDSLQTLLDGRLQKVLPVPLYVVDIVHRSERRHEEPETFFSPGQGKAAQVMPAERQAIEEDALHGNSRGRALYLSRIGQGHARLKPLEARPAALVKRHDLAVDQEVLHEQRQEGPHQIGIASGDQLSAAPVELDLGATPRRHHPDAVELDLEEPSLAGGGALAERGQHEGLAAGRHLTPRSPERLHVPADGLAPFPVGLELRCTLLDHKPSPLSAPHTTIRARRRRSVGAYPDPCYRTNP